MPGFVTGQDKRESRAREIGLSCPFEFARFVPPMTGFQFYPNDEIFRHVINPLSTELVLLRWLDNGFVPFSFCVFIDHNDGICCERSTESGALQNGLGMYLTRTWTHFPALPRNGEFKL